VRATIAHSIGCRSMAPAVESSASLAEALRFEVGRLVFHKVPRRGPQQAEAAAALVRRVHAVWDDLVVTNGQPLEAVASSAQTAVDWPLEPLQRQLVLKLGRIAELSNEIWVAEQALAHAKELCAMEHAYFDEFEAPGKGQAYLGHQLGLSRRHPENSVSRVGACANASAARSSVAAAEAAAAAAAPAAAAAAEAEVGTEPQAAASPARRCSSTCGSCSSKKPSRASFSALRMAARFCRRPRSRGAEAAPGEDDKRAAMRLEGCSSFERAQ